jgi:hypothetical protein
MTDTSQSSRRFMMTCRRRRIKSRDTPSAAWAWLIIPK